MSFWVEQGWLYLNKDSHGGMFRCPVKLNRKSPDGFLLGPSKRDRAKDLETE